MRSAIALTWRSVSPSQTTKQSAAEVLARTSMTTESQAFLSTAAPRSSRASCRGVVRAAFNFSTVKAMGGDVPLDGGRYLALDRSPFLYVLTDLAGGDVGRPHQAKDHSLAVQPGGIEVGLLRRSTARPRHH